MAIKRKQIMIDDYFSQFNQDKFLNEVVFCNKKNGFFIDIGAYDGISFSNSLFFERSNDWSGICVEPNPSVFSKLVSLRKSINLNVCIGSENKKVKFTQIEGYSEMLSGIAEEYDNRHIERINNNILIKGGKINEIEVDMITLRDIVELKNKKIDFISIDTEGNEFEIVNSINFDFLDVKALVVENNYKDNRIREHLNSVGFEYIYKLDCDEVFLNKLYFSFGIKTRLLFWKSKSLLMRKINKMRLKL
jgi:FkbM family methyltransferase